MQLDVGKQIRLADKKEGLNKPNPTSSKPWCYKSGLFQSPPFLPASPIFLPTFIRRSLERLRNASDSSRCTPSVSFLLGSLIRPLNFVHKSFPSPLRALLIDSRYGFCREVTVQKILQIKPPYKDVRMKDGEEAKEADRRKGMIIKQVHLQHRGFEVQAFCSDRKRIWKAIESKSEQVRKGALVHNYCVYYPQSLEVFSQTEREQSRFI